MKRESPIKTPFFFPIISAKSPESKSIAVTMIQAIPINNPTKEASFPNCSTPIGRANSNIEIKIATGRKAKPTLKELKKALFLKWTENTISQQKIQNTN